MPQKTLIFALFAPPEMLRVGNLPFPPVPYGNKFPDLSILKTKRRKI